jgi:hypothetical protein
VRRARAETTTKVWREKRESGDYVFRYFATVKSFIRGADGAELPFAERTVEGELERSWN